MTWLLFSALTYVAMENTMACYLFGTLLLTLLAGIFCRFAASAGVSSVQPGMSK